ncbi:MAG: cupredoxin domain-containing protein [Rhodocyclaceae bacterium]|nr:cupredoxin domain-containing protein [Rhodocyclaceae bacterium]
MFAAQSHWLWIFTLWLGLGWAVSSHAQSGELLTFQVVAKGGRLSPTRLDVPVGQRIKLVIKNEGPGPIEFENLAMRVEKVLSPGATSFVVLPKLKPGEYEFIDEFHMDTGKMWVIAK